MSRRIEQQIRKTESRLRELKKNRKIVHHRVGILKLRLKKVLTSADDPKAAHAARKIKDIVDIIRRFETTTGVSLGPGG